MESDSKHDLPFIREKLEARFKNAVDAYLGEPDEFISGRYYGMADGVYLALSLFNWTDRVDKYEKARK